MTVVLFTCAGQRVDIVTAFGRAGATTLAVDAERARAGALRSPTAARSCRAVDDPGYIDALRALVEQHDVRLSCRSPTSTTALLAEPRDELGALVLLPGAGDDPALRGQVPRAPLLRASTGSRRRRPGSRTSCPPSSAFPVLVKARRGFGSRHIYRARDRAELDFFLGYTTAESMVQQVCRGEEFSIDVFCDLDGRCLNAIPRTMIESKGGESIKGMTIKDAELIEHGAAGRRDARASSARRTSSASARPTARSR